MVEPPRTPAVGDPAAVLVDGASCVVLHANAAATAMSGAVRPHVPVDEWGRQAGLVDLHGNDLDRSARRLSAVVRGEAGSGELVRRKPRRGQVAGRGAVLPDAVVAEGVPDREALWVTPLPLGTDPGGAAASTTAVPAQGGPWRDGHQDDVLSRSVLLVLQPVSLPDPFDELNRRVLPDRAVIATDQAFAVSDMRRDDHPLVWVNPAFCRSTGYAEQEVLGRNCRLLQGPGTDPAAVARIRRAIEAREGVVEVLLNYRKDGTAFWNEVSLSPVLDTDGTLVNYVGIQSDVTVRVESDRAHAMALAAEKRARGRLALLVDVAEAMTELDEDTALRRVTRVLTGGLVPWCAVVVSDGVLRIPATAGLPDSEIGPPRHLLPPVDGDDPLGELLRGRRRGILEVDCDPTSHPEEGVTRWAMQQLGRREPGRCAVVTIPGRRGVPAVLLVGLPDEIAEPEDQEAAEDRALLAEAVRRIGLSLENARLYAREHLVAETLQRSMLPEQSSVPGLDVWSYYAPSVGHAQVGGDWYDLLQPDEASVGVVIGDVVGHDIEAAAAMGQLRSVVRAYAFEQQEPGEVLMRVDQLVAGMRIQRSASMVYARLTREDDDGWELSWCRAGHLPPLLVRGGEVETLMQPGGPMVGFETGRRATSYAHLDPGDVLVLYTDGLIERRARPLVDGLRLLSDLCADLPPMDAAGIGERLLAALGDEPEDDLAIVVVRIPSAQEPIAASPPQDARSRRWQLPGTPATVGRARRLAAQTCRLWGLPDSRTAELVVSELVANAVLHGWGTVGVRLQHVDGVLVVEVDDANPAPPLRASAPRDAPGGFGLNVVDRLCEWGWRPSGGGKTVWARMRP